ncbi:unnamed protein product [Cunninghamella echinulata]
MPFSPRRSLSASIRLPQVNVDCLSRTSPEFKAIAELNIIYEAGLDNDSRPILILCANNLPNPDTFDYDLILAFILTRLDEFVESDYVLIFFSSPARYRPSWLWLIKAYRALDRRYKKNLKALYVVHLTRSYQIIFDLANKITSPKFARKLRYLSSLDELKQLIHVAENMIPQPVIDFDNTLPIVPSTFKVNSVTPAPQVSISFGRSLQDLANLEGWTLKSEHPVPKVVYQVIEHIRANGLDKEGLFRKSPSSEELRQVKNKFSYGEQVNLNEHDIDVSAALLKVFLRELPTSVITSQQSNELTKLISGKEKDDVIRQKLQDGFAHKPYAFKLIQYLCKFLSEVEQHSGSNRMTAHNLAVVFAPNLIHANDPNENNNNPTTQQEAMTNAKLYLEQMNQAISVVEYLILHQQSLFT